MRKRKVTVVGNCQAAAITHFYRDFVGTPSGEEVAYFDDLGLQPAEVQAAVAGSDVVIVQERDFKHGLTAEELGPGVEVFAFPMVLAGFLWPYANEPHIHNTALPPFTEGPYPPQLSDSYLNRLIAKGVEPEAALEQYLALDIAKAAHIDRVFEIYIEKQQERDEKTGFEIAPTLEDDFRREALFMSPHHPYARMFGLVAAQLFEIMGIAGSTIRTAVSSLHRSPFPNGELPIHPGIIKHFGLEYVTPQSRYAYLDEGRFTFEEFVLRYMRYEHNHDLRRGVYLAPDGDPQDALESLERGLQRFPGSPGGLRAKARALTRLGRNEEALATAREAVAADPETPETRIDLGRLLHLTGALEDAQREAEAAIALAPNLAEAHQLLAEVLLGRGDTAGSAAAALESDRVMPGRAAIVSLAARAFARAGDLDRARAEAERALRIAPEKHELTDLLADILERQGDRASAIGLLETAIAEGRQTPRTWALLAHYRLRDGDLDRAQAAAERAVEETPADANTHNLLAEILERKGDRAAAIAVLEHALAAGHVNLQSYSLLGNFHMRDRNLDRAETVFTEGVAFDRESVRPDLQACLDRVLEALGKHLRAAG